ncbi:MAG: carbohydrate binding family 9 domain-containing protein [Gemmatimonadetes bacterium]|nr:carbohydrate binding family 9 domain-containing protein [Gemmatimonadota bacterium]
MRQPYLVALAAFAVVQPLAAQAPSGSESVVVEATFSSPAAGIEAARVYSGQASRLLVDLPRLEETKEMLVDGVLDEPAWRQAALLTGFSEYQPKDGLPAEDSTEVYVWYADHAIFFGVRAFEPHGAVRATLADRDKLTNDDQIQIFLDTFNDRRRALVFLVNPYGSQSDGTRSENGSGGGSNDLSEDFQYQSKGRLTDYGYEVEVRIPFKSLRYESAPVQTWGINVLREVQHSQHEQSWAPLRKGNASMLVQSGKLTGMTKIKRGLVLNLNPTTTTRMPGASVAGSWDYANPKPEFGLNARWGISTNLTLNATANPDFSQVEADVQQNQFDPRSAVSFPEKRPFFVEGSELFDAPNSLIYTRSIGQPVGALKLNGKAAGTSVALLSAVDDKPFSATGSNPVFNIVRLKRDFGAQSTAGLVYTDRMDGANYNRVVGADARYVFSKIWFAFFQYAHSFDRTAGLASSGPLWQAQLDRTGKYYGNSVNLKALSGNFRTRSGFVSRNNQVNGSINNRFTFFGKRGSLFDSYTFSLQLSGNWRYRQFFDGTIPNDPKLHFNNSFNLRGGWKVNANYFLESFKYDQQLYANYYIERTLASGVKDTIPYAGVDRITNHDYSLSITTPQFKTFKFSLNVIGGRDENFEEWAPAYVSFPTATLDWFPTSKIRVNARYPLSLYIRATDHSTVKRRQIPRLKVEYQATRAIFFRFVGQYDAQYRDSLRDVSRTEFPILIRSATTGRFSRAAQVTKNDFRVDWLFSYQPNPGTVIFAGYGASLTEPEAFRFSDLNRTIDGFFVKLSYLFRL